MAWCIGQLGAFVVATLLFAVGVGIVTGNIPVVEKVPAGGQFNPLGGCFANVDQLRAGTSGIAGAERVSNWVAIGNGVFEVVTENGRVGIEATEIIVVGGQLRAGAFLRFQVRVTNGDCLALASDSVDAAVQIVNIRGFVTTADTALKSPVVGGVPDQIGEIGRASCRERV